MGSASRDGGHGRDRHVAGRCARRRDEERRGVSEVGRRGHREPGKIGSFIVLEANPLDDIANTRKIREVYLRGDKVDRTTY